MLNKTFIDLKIENYPIFSWENDKKCQNFSKVQKSAQHIHKIKKKYPTDLKSNKKANNFKKMTENRPLHDDRLQFATPSPMNQVVDIYN